MGWWGGEALVDSHGIRAVDAGFLIGVTVSCPRGMHNAFFGSEEGFFFCFEGARKIVEEGLDGIVERDMVEDADNEQNDHQHQGSGCCLDTEKTE